MASLIHLTAEHRRSLEGALGRYPDGNEEERRREDRLLRDLPPRFQAAGRIERIDDLLKIGKWKFPLVGFIEQNSPESISKSTDSAFELARKGAAIEAVEELCKLNGVKTRMATAILTFYDPDHYTVLDWRAWRSLVHLRVLDAFECWFEDPGDYPPYLDACRQLAAWFRHSLRDTDRALWELGPEDDPVASGGGSA